MVRKEPEAAGVGVAPLAALPPLPREENRMNATDTIAALQDRAFTAYRASAPFRARVDSIVAYTMSRIGPGDPHKVERHAHLVAQEACAALLQAIYEDDAEIRSLKAEVDAIRRAYEGFISVNMKPPPCPTQPLPRRT
jgi:hypothetical protein